tara:strand:+ start:155 stop:280 length:126 start_codon:yes stop_codon:yes gene_type:complete
MAEKAVEFKALGSEIYLSEDGTVREAIALDREGYVPAVRVA